MHVHILVASAYKWVMYNLESTSNESYKSWHRMHDYAHEDMIVSICRESLTQYTQHSKIMPINGHGKWRLLLISDSSKYIELILMSNCSRNAREFWSACLWSLSENIWLAYNDMNTWNEVYQYTRQKSWFFKTKIIVESAPFEPIIHLYAMPPKR